MAALSALRTSLGLKLTDQNLRVLTAAQMNSLLNEALEVWVEETGELLQMNAFPAVAKEFMVDAPSDIIALKSAWWAPTIYSPIRIASAAEFDAYCGFDHTGGSIPEMILLEGSNSSNNPTDLKFRLYPAPGTASNATTINDAGGINTTDTTIGVTDITKFRSPSGWVICESEKIMYQQVDTTNSQLKQCLRGQGNTTAASHADTTAITQCDLVVRYLRMPKVLSADADVPEIHARFHKYLVLYALAEALALDGREGEAALQRKHWHEAVIQGRRHVLNRFGGAPAKFLPSDY